MFFRILKKDLKRKKVMNAVLLSFILLAAMFVASGLSNVVSVMNGTDHYLKKAGIGDYVVISMGEESKTALEDVLQGNDDIKECRIEPVIWGDKSNLKKADGTKIEAKNPVVFQALEDSQLKYFDKDNKQITEIQPGHAYVTRDFMEENDLKTGDKITVTYDSIFFFVTLDGTAKDALFGSPMMQNRRFLFNEREMEKLF